MKIQAVIPAAGVGTRFRSHIPKPLVLIKGKPIIWHTLKIFQENPLVDSIIVVGNKKYLPSFAKVVRQNKFTKVKKIIPGGATRRESVGRGLNALDFDTEIVAIHDAARPFVTSKLINQAIAAAKKEKAAIIAVPVKSTIKTVKHGTRIVEETLDRNTLWEVQTPQVFKKAIIVKAHKKIKIPDPSDDALLVEKLGIKVKVVMGDYRNIKITTKEDLILAKAILASRKN